MKTNGIRLCLELDAGLVGKPDLLNNKTIYELYFYLPALKISL